MAKRTVTRWISKEMRDSMVGEVAANLNKSDYRPCPVELTVEDGECWCATDGAICCEPKDTHCACCSLEYSTLPRVPCKCGKRPAPPKPETVDRVVEGCYIRNRGSFDGFKHDDFLPGEPKSPCCNYRGRECVRATLIIHEPVKEQTLVEACEAFLMATSPEFDGPYVAAIRAALAREKAAKSKANAR